MNTPGLWAYVCTLLSLKEIGIRLDAVPRKIRALFSARAFGQHCDALLSLCCLPGIGELLGTVAPAQECNRSSRSHNVNFALEPHNYAHIENPVREIPMIVKR
jgi:hypothetical protein